MIRSPRPQTEVEILRGRIRDTRAQIAQLEQPSSLGPRHEVRLRPRWNEQIEELRVHLAGLEGQLREARQASNG